MHASFTFFFIHLVLASLTTTPLVPFALSPTYSSFMICYLQSLHSMRLQLWAYFQRRFALCFPVLGYWHADHCSLNAGGQASVSSGYGTGQGPGAFSPQHQSHVHLHLDSSAETLPHQPLWRRQPALVDGPQNGFSLPGPHDPHCSTSQAVPYIVWLHNTT